MVHRPDSTDADAADPWLKAALQRSAGPTPGEAAPVAQAQTQAPASGPEPAADEEGRSAEARLDAEGVAVEPAAEPAPRSDPSVVRRLAVQALYVLGGEPQTPRDRLLEALEEPFDDEDEPDGQADHPEAAKHEAVELALAAWANHAAADAAVVARVPAWPTLRQPPVDRAILRLAHHELTIDRAPFAVIIDEAVELAHAFGEDRTPGFVNAVLDGLARGGAAQEQTPDGDTGEVRRATGPRPAAGAAEARRGQRERFNVRKAEMAAKIGPKHPRPEAPRTDEPRERPQRETTEPAGAAAGPGTPPRVEPEPPTPRPAAAPEPAPSQPVDPQPAPPQPADPWAAAAARRDPGAAENPR